MQQMAGSPPSLDQTDRRILAALQSDARMSYQDLGSTVGLSAPAAYQRVKKLEDEGILQGYHARVDPAAVGRGVTAFLRARPGPGTDVVALIERWRLQADVLECHRLAADGCYLIKLSLRASADMEGYLDAARRAGCDATIDLVTSTAFERWTRPLAEPVDGAVSRR